MAQNRKKADNQLTENRRDALKQIMGLPVLGGLGAGFGAHFMIEEQKLLAEEKKAAAVKSDQPPKVDAVSSATRVSWENAEMAKLKKPVPHGKIKDLEISRLVLGGNLIGGWAHSRDLVYVSELVKRYHTKEKVFQTFWLAEKCGINTFMGNPIMYPMMEDYYSEYGGKIQFISDCGGRRPMVENMQEAIDHGCDACYIHGGIADQLVKDKKFDEIIKAFELVRKNDIPVGFGAHYFETIEGVVQQGIIPDFWMKTFHPTDYWSAKHPQEHDNIFCRTPDKTRSFMESRPEPWIAFKVMAAGAIRPKQGFQFAYEGGADFICAGMYDFQITEDANLCVDILESKLNRKRPWING